MTFASMLITIIALAYTIAGIVLPLFYLLQVRLCMCDQSGLASYSLGKAWVQCLLRAVMLPFVFNLNVPLMTFTVGLDFAGRVAELIAAMFSLRRQGWSWRAIATRINPTKYFAGVSRQLKGGGASASNPTDVHDGPGRLSVVANCADSAPAGSITPATPAASSEAPVQPASHPVKASIVMRTRGP